MGDIADDGITKVARWAAVPRDPSKPMRAGIKPNLDIAFAADTPLVGGKSVVNLLQFLRSYVVSDVAGPISQFLPDPAP